MNGLMDYMPKPPFSYENIEDLLSPYKVHYRVRDGDDNRIATCYEEGNARFIVATLNQVYKK